MKTKAVNKIEGRIDELLAVLDKDVRHMQESLSMLNELRCLVVKRDDASLGKLLVSIQSESDNYRSNELERQSIRKHLAFDLGCSIEQVTLSRLEAELMGEKKARIAERKSQLRSLAEELKRQHLATAMLLSDCARFNSMLLESVFGLAGTRTITYDCNGSTKRQSNNTFVSFQF